MRGRVVTIVGVLLAINVAFIVSDLVLNTEQVSGPAASSYVTTGEGTAAWHDLLEQTGHEVSRRRDPAAQLDPGSTLILLEPAPDRFDEAIARTIRAFVEDGGRLVAGGALPDWMSSIVDGDLAWAPVPIGTTKRANPAPETTYVDAVAINSIGAWDRLPDGSETLLADAEGRVVAAAFDHGRGRIVLLADVTPVMNSSIAAADNAAFSLGIVGEGGRPVVFDEYVHGYADEEGLTALPDAWLWAFGLGAIALIAYLIAIGSRLGPPEEPDRMLAPARRRYLDAMAGMLEKTGQPEAAAAPIRSEVRRMIALRGGRSLDDATDGISEAASRLGLSADEINAVVGTDHDKESLMTSSRLLARLTRTQGRGESF